MDFLLLYYEARREEHDSYGLRARFFIRFRRAPLRRHTRRHVEFLIGAFEHC